MSPEPSLNQELNLLRRARRLPPAPRRRRGRQHHPQVEKLAVACRRAGLTARFDTLTAEKASMIAHAVDVHGIDALVRAALERHRPQDPARSAAAWIPTWQELRPPRPKLPPTCGNCDDYGWRPDDELGRAVRCPCRRTGFEWPEAPIGVPSARRRADPRAAHDRTHRTLYASSA
ncbi:hypothetical protein ACFQZK_31440 [Rhodococcus aetherivorans]